MRQPQPHSMVIYVDDVMMLAPENVIKDIYKWLTVGVEGDEGWKCSPMEWIGKTPVRYLGMDTRRKNTTLTSFHVSQGSYVGELLKGYPVEASKPSQVPATKDTMPFQDDLDEARGGMRARGPGHWICHSPCVWSGFEESCSRDTAQVRRTWLTGCSTGYEKRQGCGEVSEIRGCIGPDCWWRVKNACSYRWRRILQYGGLCRATTTTTLDGDLRGRCDDVGAGECHQGYIQVAYRWC